MKMRPTKLLVFGAPTSETSLVATPSVAIDRGREGAGGQTGLTDNWSV
jgi:hypothetical protein